MDQCTLMHAKGSNPKRLTKRDFNNVESLSWSPDGNYVV